MLKLQFENTEIRIYAKGVIWGLLSLIARAPIHNGRWAMEQTREAIVQNLAERLGWQAACRADSRVARRLYRKQVVDGVYRLDEGAWLDACFDCLQELGGD
jgi:hypothetical protein